MPVTEWVWVTIVIWIFSLIYSAGMKDKNIQAIGSMLGIAFGIIYLPTSFVMGLAMILLNFYLLYQSVIES